MCLEFKLDLNYKCTTERGRDGQRDTEKEMDRNGEIERETGLVHRFLHDSEREPGFPWSCS